MRGGRVPLLGIEFLTPGLARKKWLTVVRTPALAMGRELLLLGLLIGLLVYARWVDPAFVTIQSQASLAQHAWEIALAMAALSPPIKWAITPAEATFTKITWSKPRALKLLPKAKIPWIS